MCIRRAWNALLCGSLLCGLLSCASRMSTAPHTAPPTIIHVVRHAEKADPKDPNTALSEAGMERARALATVLGEADVQRIYATTYLRTQQTVGPLAQRAGLEVIALAPHATEELVRRITTEDRGKVVVVCGHSNTVPGIVQALSGTAVDPLTEEQFDRLYTVELPVEGAAKVTVTRYGAPTP